MTPAPRPLLLTKGEEQLIRVLRALPTSDLFRYAQGGEPPELARRHCVEGCFRTLYTERPAEIVDVRP